MRLKQLEIKGFKSFPDKTVIHFNDDITGIVGPNGCGKSNIIDAIRWVLGEQKSSMLRSERMENLIFNGSKTRKASGLATVSLTFENTKNILPVEYSTVTINRLLYRSGESEYRLNGVSCRLKDITNLFLDTGISSDSYAIIELAIIDEILNDKEHSRRRLFEQAARISKYKQRKKETFSKLSATDADLERVDDLLFEIENNLKDLAVQAKRAKRYYKLKEQYKELNLELATYTLANYKRAYDELNLKEEEEKDKKLKIETAITKEGSIIEKEKKDNIEKEKELSDLQKKQNEKINNISQQESEKNLISEKIKFLKDQKEGLAKQIQSADTNVTSIEKEIESLTQEKTDETSSLEDIEKELTRIQQERIVIKEQYDTTKNGLEKMQNEAQGQEKQIFDIEKKIEINEVRTSNLLEEIEMSEADKLEKKEELKGYDAAIKELKEKKASSPIDALIKADSQKKQQLEKIEEKTEILKSALVTTNRQLDAKQNEYNLNKSLIDNLEGFPESIRFLKTHKPWAKDAPLLSDIISCKEEYRVAIENFLEPWLNYYVVDNLEEAIMAVNLLSDAAKGRANFFILDQFKDYTKSSDDSNNGISALAVIDMDKKYQKLCEYLLDRVVIIDDPGSFDEKLRLKDKEAVLITKTGKWILTNYALSGGAIGLFEGNRIGRAKKLEKLESEIKKLEVQTIDIKKQISELQKKNDELDRSLNEEEKVIDQEKEVLNKLNQELISIQTRIENYTSIADTRQSRKEEIETNIKKIEEENELAKKQLTDLNNKKHTNTSQINKLSNTYKQISEKFDTISEQYNEQNIRFHQQQNKVNAVSQALNYKQETLEDIKTQLITNTATIESTDQEVIDSEEKLQTLETSLIAAYLEKEGLEKIVNKAEETYYASRGKINELENGLKELIKNKEQIDELINAFKEKVNELKLELHSLKERLSIEFKVDIDDIIDKDPSDKYSQEELKEKVEKMKQRIENFGEINPLAVEAYDEMEKRSQFIIEQKNDLLEAKKSLLQTIDEIEKIATERFLEAFTKVRENFIKVFHILFSEEDNCDLLLTDESNPLDSSIEIIARPKGKKPLSINQLSGGEKTLTATALVFSLYLLNPAPFCILDEIDAPLDDANIGKFNNIIRDFSTTSQFIIVTHNKQTMTSLDVIYGITMPEEGVSKVVPVDFRSLKPLARSSVAAV